MFWEWNRVDWLRQEWSTTWEVAGRWCVWFRYNIIFASIRARGGGTTTIMLTWHSLQKEDKNLVPSSLEQEMNIITTWTPSDSILHTSDNNKEPIGSATETAKKIQSIRLNKSLYAHARTYNKCPINITDLIVKFFRKGCTHPPTAMCTHKLRWWQSDSESLFYATQKHYKCSSSRKQIQMIMQRTWTTW